MQAYSSLEARFARLSAIEDALGILQWDAETLMPEGASEGRSDQLATLKALAAEEEQCCERAFPSVAL